LYHDSRAQRIIRRWKQKALADAETPRAFGVINKE
jgi:hypothetical protein